LNQTRAIFLDRDGTLIQEKEYLHRPEEVAVLPGAGAALRRLQEAGFRLFIVSNQSGVGRGWFTLDDVAKVNARLAADLARDGVRFDKIYIAPEAPGQPSRGRKPSPQFLFDARDEFGLRLEESYFVGDKMMDLECGWNGGAKKSILVRTGYGREAEKSGDARLVAAVIVDDLPAAAGWILARKREDTRMEDGKASCHQLGRVHPAAQSRWTSFSLDLMACWRSHVTDPRQEWSPRLSRTKMKSHWHTVGPSNPSAPFSRMSSLLGSPWSL